MFDTGQSAALDVEELGDDRVGFADRLVAGEPGCAVTRGGSVDDAMADAADGGVWTCSASRKRAH
jgi:hypothetical protein